MSSPAPVTPAERVEVMDVLRGVALFGVFLMNMAPFAGTPIMATEQQLLSLPSAGYDFALLDVLRWLVADKANTIFAFLFGLGFYLQMQRLQFRGADFEALYKRRLTVLLCIGCVHLFFFWTWDILHLYALAGFILLPLRRLSNRDLLAIGIILGLLGRTAQKTLAEFIPGMSWTGLPGGYEDSDILLRQQISESGDYFRLVGNFFEWVVVDYVASGMIFGWLAYALGRFLIGAWVGRHGWIERAREFLPGWRRVRTWCLPIGLDGRSGGGHAVGSFMGARLGASRVFRRVPAFVCGAGARDRLRGGVGGGVRRRPGARPADAIRRRGPYGAD